MIVTPAVVVPADPLSLSRALIRCPSVTPEDAGALDVLENALRPLGFVCHRLPFGGGAEPRVDNLYARLGDGSPHFCFAGHTDVVPVGEADQWTVDPFGAVIRDGRLYGRGASDMKAAIACFVAATSRFLAERDGQLPGSISLLITGDEEGPAVNGTAKVLEWLRQRGERMDGCLVGEPTNPHELGEMIKIGRRGSINFRLTVHGIQGHAAYPQFADNPVSRLVRMLAAIDATPLDHGSEHFDVSAVALTSVDVGNPATNVIPAVAKARFNVRFNDLHTAEGVIARVRACCESVGGAFELDAKSSGESFLSPPGWLSAAIGEAVARVTGRVPVLSTSGGTSDARFIKDLCPVAEFGMTGETAHKVDENITVADIERLTEIYRQILATVFAGDAG